MGPSEYYGRSGGDLEENPGVWRTSSEFQKDSLTNMIPNDIFSKLNKKKAHGFLFILLIIIRPSAMKVVLQNSIVIISFCLCLGTQWFHEIGSYYQLCDNFFTKNQFKKHLLHAFSVLDFRYTKVNRVPILKDSQSNKKDWAH